MTRLNPCKICNGSAQLSIGEPKGDFVFCTNCSATSKMFKTPYKAQDAMNNWNGNKEMRIYENTN